jgi:hypothetical protein
MMFSRMLQLNSTGYCCTIPIFLRSDFRLML